jgi:hypothetical protein
MAAARNAQSSTFNYDVDPTTDSLIANGFGLTLEGRRKLKLDLEERYFRINPNLVSYKSRADKEVKATHIKQFYDAVSQFSDAPDAWKEKAITQLFSNMKSARKRRMEPSHPPDLKRRKVEPSSDDSESEPTPRQ